MTTQPIASSRPAPSVPGSARHRRIRAAAAITAVAALIATGGYLATTTIGPDAAPPTPAAGTDVNPSAQTLRDLHQSIAGQYGSRSAAGAVVNPSAQTLRELRQSIAGQYGNRPAPDATVHPERPGAARAAREHRRPVRPGSLRTHRDPTGRRPRTRGLRPRVPRRLGFAVSGNVRGAIADRTAPAASGVQREQRGGGQSHEPSRRTETARTHGRPLRRRHAAMRAGPPLHRGTCPRGSCAQPPAPLRSRRPIIGRVRRQRDAERRVDTDSEALAPRWIH